MEKKGLGQRVDPVEWDTKLNLFLKISKWSQKNLSDYSGIPTGTISGARKEPLILPKHHDSLAGAMRITEEEFLASFDLFEAALINSWRPSWRRLISELSPLPLRSNYLRLRLAPEGARLVETVEEGESVDLLKVRIGQRYRISLDIMYILKASNIELVDDTDPIFPYHLYLFQVEGEECMMLRPNVHLNRNSVSDLSDTGISGEPDWRLLVPAPAAKPSGMVFGGAPGVGDFFVLVWRRPISEKLCSDLTDPKGARLSCLDELARELRADPGDTPDLRNYWRMFRQPYQLVR